VKNFDPNAVSNKLSAMARRLQRLRRYESLALDEYLQDEDIQLIVERLLEQIIQSALDINRTFLKRVMDVPFSAEDALTNSETFVAVAEHGLISEKVGTALAKSGGFRNALAHLYDEIIPEKVYTALKLALQYYPHYISAVQDYLDSLET
jgi:uncharacterized protein YutE (UPF0331/DUF86 family)